jgi:hypothetical protein
VLTKYILDYFISIAMLQFHSPALNENWHFGHFTAGAKTCESAVEPLMQTFMAPGPRDLSWMPWLDRSKSVNRSFAPDAINLSYKWRCTCRKRVLPLTCDSVRAPEYTYSALFPPIPRWVFFVQSESRCRTWRMYCKRESRHYIDMTVSGWGC